MRLKVNATAVCFLFGFRNTTQSVADFFQTSLTMPLINEGERSGSGRLPKLRRFRICCETGGLERQVRRSRIYPNQVSCLRGHWPETPNPAYHRRLTARPAVLAKRTEPGRHASRPTSGDPGRTNSRSVVVDSGSVPANSALGNAGSPCASPACDRRRLHSIPPVGFGAI